MDVVRFLKSMRLLRNMAEVLFSESERKVLEVGKSVDFKRLRKGLEMENVKLSDIKNLDSSKHMTSKRLLQILVNSAGFQHDALERNYKTSKVKIGDIGKTTENHGKTAEMQDNEDYSRSSQDMNYGEESSRNLKLFERRDKNISSNKSKIKVKK